MCPWALTLIWFIWNHSYVIEGNAALCGQNIKVFQLLPKPMKYLAWFVFAVLYIQKLAHVLRPILTNQRKGVSGQSDSKPQPTWMSPLVLCRAFTWFYFLICDWCMKPSCNVLLLQRNTEQGRWLEYTGNSVFSYTRHNKYWKYPISG